MWYIPHLVISHVELVCWERLGENNEIKWRQNESKFLGLIVCVHCRKETKEGRNKDDIYYYLNNRLFFFLLLSFQDRRSHSRKANFRKNRTLNECNGFLRHGLVYYIKGFILFSRFCFGPYKWISYFAYASMCVFACYGISVHRRRWNFG